MTDLQQITILVERAIKFQQLIACELDSTRKNRLSKIQSKLLNLIEEKIHALRLRLFEN